MARMSNKRKTAIVVFSIITAALIFFHITTYKEGNMFRDTLDKAEKYYGIHPGFEEAFKFLKQDTIALLQAGRHEIDGKNIYASVIHDENKDKDSMQLEAHKTYIDIHYTICGTDVIGWSPLSSCYNVDVPYNKDEDISFFKDVPYSWIEVPEGSFAIFTPKDAHAPMAGSGNIHKVVIKIKEQ